MLEANKATKESLKYLFSTLAKGSDSIADTIDNLEQNKLTRELFEKENLDYASWVGFDEERDVIKYDTNTVIRKVDMNDIKHSLFLGNQACCCTAIGTSTRSEYAPLYIMNNFLQAIELVVDGKAVGNTMCYIARSMNGENILVFDNMEVLPPYKDEKKYLDMFLLFARRLTKNIGKKSLFTLNSIKILLLIIRNKIFKNIFVNLSCFIAPFFSSINSCFSGRSF